MMWGECNKWVGNPSLEREIGRSCEMCLECSQKLVAMLETILLGGGNSFTRVEENGQFWERLKNFAWAVESESWRF